MIYSWGILDWIFIIVVGISTILCLVIYYFGDKSDNDSFKNFFIRNGKNEHIRQIMINQREDEKNNRKKDK